MATLETPLETPKAGQPPAWKALKEHFSKIRKVHLRKLFSKDPARGDRLAVEALGLYLDYSKNRITDETVQLLLRLAEESGLRAKIDAMFRGDKINITENRAVLHVPCARPKELPSSWTEKTSCPEFTLCSTRWRASANVSAAGLGKATPASVFVT